jgi:hypothetical protein
MVLSPDAGSILMVDKDNLYLYMIDGSSGTVQASIDISYLDRKAVDELVGRYAFRLQDAWDGQLLVLPDGKSLHVYNNRGEEIAVIETNLENGDVEVIIQGEQNDIDEFLELTRKGNRFIRVDNIQLKMLPVVEGEKKFTYHW